MMTTLLKHSLPFFLPSRHPSPFSSARTKIQFQNPLPFKPKPFNLFFKTQFSSNSSQSQSLSTANTNNPVQTPSSSSSEFQIFNTMTKQKEVFRPNFPGKVGMYVCGVTAYDLSHIGHARVYVTFDVLCRPGI